MHKDNKNIGDLFEVKIKTYNFFNKDEKIIKTISKPIEKKFIKQIEKKEYDGHFQEKCLKAQLITGGLGFVSMICTFSSLSFPPLCLGLLITSEIFYSISFI